MAAEGAWPAKDACSYTKCYCEENVYRLLSLEAFADRGFAVFISNSSRTVALWSSAAAADAAAAAGKAASSSSLVVWDYHVIALLLRSEEEGGSLVFDFDSLCAWPSRLDDYLRATFTAPEG
eukprot:PLAT12602.1.p1 GENE.PLAT12602.1~~PLAT12602.1.p1  ORF type:complete len:141 (-),score=41.58 PLAT12602.1:366-731(-)